MSRREWMRRLAVLAIPISLLSATPAVQFCAGVTFPLSERQLAACLVSEAVCRASAAAGSGDCGPEPVACSAGGLAACDSGGMDAPSASGSCSPTACDDDAEESPRAPTGPRAFCVGSPSGGPGVLPLPDLDGPAQDAVLDAGAVELPPSARPGPHRLAFTRTHPPPDRGAAPHAIRGPPSA